MACCESQPITIEDARRATEDLVGIIHRYLKSETGITPYMILKGGSVGCGTAVPGDFDLNLVIYTGDIDASSIARSQDPFRPWLKRLKDFLERVKDVVVEPVNPSGPLYLLCFTYKAKVDIDLLISPTWDTPDDYYRFLRGVNKEKRHSFSVGACRWQVDFFSHQPNKSSDCCFSAAQLKDVFEMIAGGGSFNA